MTNIFAAVATPAIHLLSRATRRDRRDAFNSKRCVDVAPFLERSFDATGAQATHFVARHFSETEVEGVPDFYLHYVREQLEYRCARSGLETSVICKTLPSQQIGCKRLVVVIRMSGDAPASGQLQMAVDEIITAVQWLDRAIGCNLEPSITAQVNGFREGNFTGAKAAQIVSAGLWAVHAKPIEGIETADMASISAYAPRGPRSIQSGTRFMNLQIAAHYDEGRDLTEVTVGTPIIVDAY